MQFPPRILFLIALSLSQIGWAQEPDPTTGATAASSGTSSTGAAAPISATSNPTTVPPTATTTSGSTSSTPPRRANAATAPAANTPGTAPPAQPSGTAPETQNTTSADASLPQTPARTGSDVPIPVQTTAPQRNISAPETEAQVRRKPNPDVSTTGTRPNPTRELPIAKETFPPAAPLESSGQLLNQPPPSMPVVRSRAEEKLPPLRQILVQAPNLQTAEQQRRALTALGLRIVSRKTLSNLGMLLSTFKLPNDADAAELLASAEALLGQPLELNQRYRLLGKPNSRHSYAQAMVGAGVPSRCQQPLQLAMLDSLVNTAAGGLDAERVEVADIVGKRGLPHAHGTGVASLLISNHPQFPGLIPNGRLLAINVFADDGQGEQETRTDWLLAGLDKVAEANPAALNLSFGGDYSALLEQAFTSLAEHTLLVAAAGNDGNEELVYPAAYSTVYAVGGLDARGRPTRQSNRGETIQLLAPGEDIWTSNEKGRGYYASGTSFAAPFATAALALVRAQGLAPENYLAGLESKRVDFRALCNRS